MDLFLFQKFDVIVDLYSRLIYVLNKLDTVLRDLNQSSPWL